MNSSSRSWTFSRKPLTVGRSSTSFHFRLTSCCLAVSMRTMVATMSLSSSWNARDKAFAGLSSSVKRDAVSGILPCCHFFKPAFKLLAACCLKWLVFRHDLEMLKINTKVAHKTNPAGSLKEKDAKISYEETMDKQRLDLYWQPVVEKGRIGSKVC